jgi:nitroreductase
MLALHVDAIEPMYGERAMEYALLEAGLMSQLLETEGPDEGLGFCQIGGMDYGPVYPILDLGERDKLIYSLLGGGLPSQHVPRFFSWEEDSL